MLKDQKTYKIVTLGCKVNAYEADAIAENFNYLGYLPAKHDDKVDIAIVNTCSVTSTSDQKSRQQIRRLITKHPEATIVVMGCYSQINQNLASEIPDIDVVVGTSNRHKIAELVEKHRLTKQQIVAVEKDARLFDYEELNYTSVTNHARAYLKIQDGCDNFCTFCIIPLTRGRLRSRQPHEVIKEAQNLVKKGYKEIVLTGIHTGGYGRDLPDYSFTSLVKDILVSCPDLFSLRISSIEENEITDELIGIIKSDKRMAHHLHIPLQAGSDEILKKMNRHYDTRQFTEKIEAIRRIVPDIAITTDVIVGFPGETDELFEETVHTIRRLNFAEMHVFPYSVRTRTPAAKMKAQIDPQIKKARVHKLIELSDHLKSLYYQKFNGCILEVLIENQETKTGLYYGHTSNYMLVRINATEDVKHKVVSVVFSSDGVSQIIDA
jgi:threonylcarbamoyladenosine tRNA methylthiotransferase MtaB